MSPIILRGKAIKKLSGAVREGVPPAASLPDSERPVCDKRVPPVATGDCEYYQRRHDNFLGRHQSCVHHPPDYYLSYGKKYCVRFSTELYPKLTPKGQAWLAKARLNLQVAIEAGLSKQPLLELENEAFRRVAFKTHPDAYWKAGLHDLPLGDKVKIALTPDAKEWLSGDTWNQAVDVAGRDARATANDATSSVERVAEDVKQYFRGLFK